MNDNKIKSIKGIVCKQLLLNSLIDLQQKKVIAYCETQYRDGYADFSTNQFFAPFLVEFTNGEMWILFSTNSIRTDRVCIQQWNSYHIKNIRPSVSKSFLVIPNEIVNNKKEFEIAMSYNEKIYNNEIFSSIDGVYLQEQIIEKIAEHGRSIGK